MPETFLHGIEILDVDAGPRQIRTVGSSVVGIVGTSPDADVDAFPVNTPVLIASNRREAAKLNTLDTGNGTLPSAVEGIMGQIGAVVIVVRFEIESTLNTKR